MSARRYAPSLVPQVIINGLRDKGFEAWLQRMGGTVQHWNLSFLPALREAVNEPNRSSFSLGGVECGGGIRGVECGGILAIIEKSMLRNYGINGFTLYR